MFSEIVMGIEKEHFFKLKEQLFAERKDEDKIETYKMVIKASKELYKKEVFTNSILSIASSLIREQLCNLLLFQI